MMIVTIGQYTFWLSYVAIMPKLKHNVSSDMMIWLPKRSQVQLTLLQSSNHFKHVRARPLLEAAAPDVLAEISCISLESIQPYANQLLSNFTHSEPKAGQRRLQLETGETLCKTTTKLLNTRHLKLHQILPRTQMRNGPVAD